MRRCIPPSGAVLCERLLPVSQKTGISLDWSLPKISDLSRLFRKGRVAIGLSGAPIALQSGDRIPFCDLPRNGGFVRGSSPSPPLASICRFASNEPRRSLGIPSRSRHASLQSGNHARALTKPDFATQTGFSPRKTPVTLLKLTRLDVCLSAKVPGQGCRRGCSRVRRARTSGL